MLTITPGQRLENIRLAMAPGGVISGRVTDNGQPIGLTDVSAVKLIDNNGTPTPVTVLSAKTNDLGEYRIFGLPPGYYSVVAVVNDAATQGPLVISPDGDDNSSVFFARTTFRAVLNRSIGVGAGEDERHVPMFFPSTPDPERASLIEVRAGSEARNIDIESPVLRTFHVRGRVTGIPAPASGQEQTSRPVVQLIKATFPSGIIRPLNGNADADGKFDLPYAISGTYVLLTAMGSLLGSTPIEIRDQDVNNVEISLAGGINVSGRVVIEREAAANPSPDPGMTSLRVILNPSTPTLPIYGSVPSPDGTFRIPSTNAALAVTTGEYRVLVAPLLALPTPPGQPALAIPAPLQGAYVKSIRLGDRDLLNNPLRVQGSIQPQDKLEIVIGTNPGSVEGSVQGSDGSVWVALVPENNLKFKTDHKFVATEPDGRFQLQAVPPGDYRIYAWQDIEKGTWQEPRLMRNYESRGTPIHVDEGRKTTIQFPVIPAQK
jgi:hypothetical protein